MGNKEFWASENGCRIITAICCVVLWGIALMIWLSNTDAAAIVMLICAFFGWQALTRVQPAMFVWMSWFGWIVYFVVKLLLSALIGLFVAPFVIGKKLGAVIHGSIS